MTVGDLINKLQPLDPNTLLVHGDILDLIGGIGYKIHHKDLDIAYTHGMAIMYETKESILSESDEDMIYEFE